MMEYLTEMIVFLTPYLQLFITATFVWATLVNILRLYVKIKYSNNIEDVDIERPVTGIIISMVCILLFYVK